MEEVAMIESANLTIQVGSNGQMRKIVRCKIFSLGNNSSCVSLIPERGACIFLEGSDEELLAFAEHVRRTVAGGDDD